VHDDVVDDAYERRGFLSINAVWKNKIAVLVGDFLLAKGLLLSVEHNELKILKIVSDAVQQMSEGELLQIEKVRRLDIVEDIYYEIIRQKTASLIASCCASGASSAGASEDIVEKMRLFGEYIGMAFQIKDDLLDFGYEDIGKPKGIDIKEKKITLPLIYSLNNSTKSTKSKIIKLVKYHNNEPEKVDEIIDFVRSTGGLDYAERKMFDFQQKAFDILNTFPESETKKSLEDLVKYTTERRK
jgi:octaprenyl-diphosphate synthase